MTVREMRHAISKVYPGKSWKEKVADMPEDQVVAVYFNFEARNMFNKKIEPPRKKKPIFKAYVGEQLSFDI